MFMKLVEEIGEVAEVLNKRAGRKASCDEDLQEQLAVELAVGEVFMEVIHEYPDLTVRLTLFHASIAEGVPQKLEHHDIQWITPAQIDDYDFCPADVEILERIKAVYGA